MLTKIVIEGPASFKNKATIETDKRINLIYGLNGTGKSTICKLLRSPHNPDYASCHLHGQEDAKIFVFNDDFIQENFYESEKIKGIFSLSKENKEAELKIAEVTKKRNETIAAKQKLDESTQRQSEQLAKEVDKVTDKIFNIKRDHSGGDRILEFCLDGVMGKKEKLLDRLLQVTKPIEQPTDTIKKLQEEARLLEKGAQGDGESHVPRVQLDLGTYEEDGILLKAVVGTHNSNFSDFISELRISDWVKRGFDLLDVTKEKPLACPFCQEKTIDDSVIDELSAYFDKTFGEQAAKLEQIERGYGQEIERLQPLTEYRVSIFYDSRIEALHQRLTSEMNSNLALIREKVGNPSIAITLKRTLDVVADLNAIIDQVNDAITLHNKKISNLSEAKKDIYRRFWRLMRWDYDQSVTFHTDLASQVRKLNEDKKISLDALNNILVEQESSIAEAQQKTVNIDEAIKRINSELLGIGIVDFKIKKYNDHLYQLERGGGAASPFKSLSEGEKMMIALLYFCELCEGREAPDEVHRSRVAVFDDPISSMSHIYVFNVGRLLRSRFFNANLVTQIFVFTHSLYFFYELTDTNMDRRKAEQSLFRVTKNVEGSAISVMSYEEIQNDYQSYWQVINDTKQHPAVIANCMRNVVEYFFAFVEKKDFNNVFQKPELQENKFQAFNRYMNRESHSLGQNVFDMKEFDYQIFKDGLRLIFEASGYPEHYKQMAKIS
jgi:wobble nucleotide-excising tRNase